MSTSTQSPGEPSVSVVIPAHNEAATIAHVISASQQALPGAEVIVVDDGSADRTSEIAIEAGAKVVTHPYSKGNGASIKSGARAAEGEILAFLDGDGQHDPSELPLLLAGIEKGYDLVVGARQGHSGHATTARWGANAFYNRLASLFVGQRIEDLTSGFRAVRRQLFIEILNLLPNGFSYPTTSTMAFYRSGYSVAFVPIDVSRRSKQTASHIRPIRDGLRFLAIVFKVTTLYAPLKLFAPISLFLFFMALSYYGYTFATDGRFTNMGVLLWVSSIITFLIGLLSEQITQLIYVVSARDAAQHSNGRGD